MPKYEVHMKQKLKVEGIDYVEAPNGFEALTIAEQRQWPQVTQSYGPAIWVAEWAKKIKPPEPKYPCWPVS